MAGDYTRCSFDPWDDHSGVLMQQGRVQLDADWNEMVEIIDRRWRAETMDIIGRCVVPRVPPDSFKVFFDPDGELTIGRGRIYVDGLLAENHGGGGLEADPVLGEVRGKEGIKYGEQPHLSAELEQLPERGLHLFYLDVWQREVTALQEPDLVEKALGVDTATRLQTVWQVKFLEGIGETVTCATAREDIPEWAYLTRPSAGRLTTDAVGVPSSDDPCEIPPSGGYRGLQNRLYRVEIHKGGSVGSATFKWSRDNASVATAVTAISGRTLTVARIGRDPVLRFKGGDWVEITDDFLEFDRKPGLMRKVESVDEVNLTITLEAPDESTPGDPALAAAFPTSGPDGRTFPDRHTRVRRWDQKGEVRDASGVVVADVDDPNHPGLIKVPAGGTSLVLEDGVQVTFSTDPEADPNGQFQVGDYWVFAARTADASVEPLEKAPPRGIHHHYCPLAIVTFSDQVENRRAEDCRDRWPPEVPAAGCDCAVCVTAESHNKKTLTIQDAIDQVKDTGGKICLGPGTYRLEKEPATISGARSVRIEGRGPTTMLVHAGPSPAIIIENSLNVTLEGLTIRTSAVSWPEGIAVSLQNCVGVTLQRCWLEQTKTEGGAGPAIAISGFLLSTRLRENVLVADTGIASLPPVRALTSALARREWIPGSYLLTAGFHVQDNLILCDRIGIYLDKLSWHLADTRLSGNYIGGCTHGAIVLGGMVISIASFSSRLDVLGNVISARGDGIVVGTDDARISDNDIRAIKPGQGHDGIVLAPSHDPRGIERCQVLSNRIAGVAGSGIALNTKVSSAIIKQNVIEGVGGGGIVMAEESEAGGLSIENNQLLNVARKDASENVVGIGLFRANQAEVVGNTIKGVGREARESPSRVGIAVIASPSVRIAGNEVTEVGPPEFTKEAVGIEVVSSFECLDVVGNVVRRAATPPERPDTTSSWRALHIAGPVTPRKVEEVSPALRVWDLPLVGAFVIPTLDLEAVADLAFFPEGIVELPRGREIVSVRGNLLEAWGDVFAVQIAVSGTCTFTDNRCLLQSQKSTTATEIAAGAAIASANYIVGPRASVALSLRVPGKEEGPWPLTVVGNIVSGPIHVNDIALGDPWAPLNLVV